MLPPPAWPDAVKKRANPRAYVFTSGPIPTS